MGFCSNPAPPNKKKSKDRKEKGKPGWKGVLEVCQAVLTSWAWGEGEAVVEEDTQ